MTRKRNLDEHVSRKESFIREEMSLLDKKKGECKKERAISTAPLLFKWNVTQKKCT